MFQVPPCHNNGVQLFDSCNVHFMCAFLCCPCVDAELFHTFYRVFFVYCAAAWHKYEPRIIDWTDTDVRVPDSGGIGRGTSPRLI